MDKGNNRVILQGWLYLSPQQIERYSYDGRSASVMKTWIDTDRPALGGRHWVTLVGKELAKALLLLKEWGDKPLKVRATVTGYLVTYGGRSHIMAQDLVLLLGTEEPAKASSA